MPLVCNLLKRSLRNTSFKRCSGTTLILINLLRYFEPNILMSSKHLSIIWLVMSMIKPLFSAYGINSACGTSVPSLFRHLASISHPTTWPVLLLTIG